MAKRHSRAAAQTGIELAIMPLLIDRPSLTNPRTGKPTVAVQALLGQIAALLTFQRRAGRNPEHVTLSLAQVELLRNSHRDCPQKGTFDTKEAYAQALADHFARPMLYDGVELRA